MRGRLYKGQKTRETQVILTEELYAKLVDVAARYGLEPSAYARSLVVTHLTKLTKVNTAKGSADA